MTLGERIQQLRKTYGLSQEQLAEKVGVSRQAISKWETDQSLPEIEKILAISRAFSISTDELLGNEITVSESETAPGMINGKNRSFHIKTVNVLKGAGRYINGKTLYMLFTLLCIIAVGVCVIVDCAINKGVTWAVYPIISVAFGWILSAPFFFGRYMMPLLFATALTLPYLYLLNKNTPDPDWFTGIGLPAAVIGVVFVWVVYLICRFTKLNIWYKIAVPLFLGGVIVSPAIDHFVNRFLNEEMSFISLFTNIFSCVVASVVLGIVGYIRNKEKTAAKEIIAAG